ncbi:MAG: DUF5678 domain-containing protein, partial [candidate division KSB1 bacterium]|nr:DUF5678 domain-containing protein [candidate division KSB1 bacterium]
METSIHTDALPDELQGYIHEDFRENECFYWKIRDKLFETYRGKWIAIHDGEIIAVSNNLFEVTKQVGRRKCHA